MLKKLSIPVLFALLFTLVFSSTVLAAEGPPTGRIRARGEIVSVNAAAGSFQLKSVKGETLTFFVSDSTRYLGKVQSMGDLQAGWKAGVIGRQADGKNQAAAVIALEPKDRPQLSRYRGEVTAVDARMGKFRLETKEGTVLTFFVHEKTRYGGQLESLEGMEVGWQAGVGALEDEEGRLNAAVVIAGERRERPDLEKFRGTVTEVDAASGKFRLETPDGDALTFFVGERTRYRGQLESLDDLQARWKAVVGAAEDEEGALQAVFVAAGDPEDLPDGIRVRGTVTAVDAAAGKFRLETEKGEVLTFFVRERTRYRGELNSLEDLEVGWKVGVGGFEGEDGQLQALVVIAGEGGSRGQFGDPGAAFAPGSPPFGPEADF